MIHVPSALSKRILGIAFFLVVALFLAWSITTYKKVFQEVVKVTLVTDTAGNKLPTNADVKVRGVIVGEVRSTNPDGEKVVSELALDPKKIDQIPANVTARLLPKTLFGERYVSLEIPADRDSKHLEAGDTIQQDKSGNAIEIGELLDGLLPLLQAIPPQDLLSTLGSLSQGLQGRGEELGRTLDRLDRIVTEVDSELPNLIADLRGLADFSETYSDAAPDLVNALDALRTTAVTVVEQQDQIRVLVASLTATGSVGADFLEVNSDSLITIAAGSREALQTLAKYSGTFGCMITNFVPIVQRATTVLGLDENLNPTKYPGARASALFVNPRGRYLPNQDEPRLLDDRGPRCYQPAPADQRFPQYPGGSINDGSYQPPSRNPGPQDISEVPIPDYAYSSASDDASDDGANDGYVAPAAYTGSQVEKDTLSVIYSQATDLEPAEIPSWTTLLGAPALRGMEVTVQ